MYKGKRKRIECKNDRKISLESVGGKLYGEILVGSVRKVIEGEVIDDEQGGFRSGRGK